MLISLIVSLIVIGVVLYLIEILIPIDYRIKRVIYLLIGIYVILWLLAALGINVPILGGLLR